MRFLVLAAAALLPQASAAAPVEPTGTPVAKPGPTQAAECRKATSHEADGTLAWRGQPLTPKKLTELPTGNGYMAVYRTVNGCEEPMTVVEYRNGGRR